MDTNPFHVGTEAFRQYNERTRLARQAGAAAARGEPVIAPGAVSAAGDTYGPVQNYVFPSTLVGQLPSQAPTYPFVHFNLIKFRDRWNIKDKSDGSSPIAVVASDQKITIANITLPLPQDVQSTVAPQWDMMDSKILSGVMDIFKNGLLNNDTWNNLVAIVTPTIQQKIYQNTANPKKQAFFQGIDPRDFTFSWVLTPQSKEEAFTVRNIVGCFTVNSLPDIKSSDQAFFLFPCEYMIQFAGVTGFPQFPESLVCTGVAVNYTPNGLELTTDGHAVSTTLTLAFKETTIRTQGSPGI